MRERLLPRKKVLLIGGGCGLLPATAGIAAPLPLQESLDSATRIYDALLPGVKRVALGAHIDVQGLGGRARREAVTARAGYQRVVVVGRMNAISHGLGCPILCILCILASWAPGPHEIRPWLCNHLGLNLGA